MLRDALVVIAVATTGWTSVLVSRDSLSAAGAVADWLWLLVVVVVVGFAEGVRREVVSEGSLLCSPRPTSCEVVDVIELESEAVDAGMAAAAMRRCPFSQESETTPELN